MIDIRLIADPTQVYDHDLYFSNYDLDIVNGLDAIRQHLAIRMQFFFAEWFLDISKGIKFYDFVFIKNPDLTTIASVMKAYISETPGVLEILEYSQDFDARLRKLTITYKVDTDLGEITSTIPVGA